MVDKKSKIPYYIQVKNDLMEKIKGSRPGGFTLAPEAATNHMRKIINKPVQTEQLLDTAREIYLLLFVVFKPEPAMLLKSFNILKTIKTPAYL